MTVETMEVRPRGAWLRRTRIDPRIWVLAALYAVVVATNSGFAQSPTDDALDYRRIADAAPQLPSNPPVASAFTARLAIHYVVGLAHKCTGLALDTTYNVVFAVLMAMLLAVVYRLFRSLNFSDFAVVAALFVFDPYSFRPYLLQTETLQDPVFVLGIGICLLGLRARSTRALLIGLVVALLGRQTAVLAAPVLAAWVLFDPRWRCRTDGRRAWGTAAAALTVTAVLFVAIRILSARFSIHYEPTGLHDTIFNLVSGLPGTVTEMAAHFARLAIPLLVPLAAFGALVAVVGRRRVPLASWAGLALCAAIIAQPAVTDPRFPGFAFNEQRLAALGLLPLVCGIAVLLGQTRPRRPGPWVALLLVGILAVESLHHEFSWFGPQSLAQFLAGQLAAATAVAAVLLWDRSPGAPGGRPGGGHQVPQRNAEDPAAAMTATFATTLDYTDPRWLARSRLISALPRRHGLHDEVRQFLRVLRGLRDERLVLVDSSTGRFQPDFLASALVGAVLPRTRRPRVVMYGDLWQLDGGLRGRIERLLVRAADRTVVRYAALSTDEIQVFPQTWGVGAGKVRFTPYFATLTADDLAEPAPPVGDYVFAGGNSHRDYLTLVDAARLLPDRQFVIATHLLEGCELPANVSAAPVSHPEFVRLLRGAHTVVVPLAAGLCRSTGHQTYLNAMLLGKPTVITDTLGVADHARAGETALVVPASAPAYAEAIGWTFAPENADAVAALGKSAQADVAARFTFDKHVEALLAVIDEAADAADPLDRSQASTWSRS